MAQIFYDGLVAQKLSTWTNPQFLSMFYCIYDIMLISDCFVDLKAPVYNLKKALQICGRL